MEGKVSVARVIKTFCVFQRGKRNPWPQAERELYGHSNYILSAKLVITFADKGLACNQHGGSLMAVISVF
jgi:hypothetical protein